MKTLTIEQTTRRAELRARHDRHQSAWQRIASHSRGGSSATPEQQAMIDKEGGPFSNDERAELETLDFMANDAAKVFCYPSEDGRALTGWMGNELLSVTGGGPKFQSNMGDWRESVRALGINGRRYVGTIYGTYARLRLAK